MRFDGFDIFLYHPHFNIDGGDEETKRLADKARARNLEVGSVVAPVYPGTGGGLPMGGKADREKFLDQIHKACHVGQRLRELGVRPNGVVRIDSACGVEQWCEDPKGNQKRIADTFREACKIAEDHDERLAAEGEICWGGMHSWRRMIELLGDGRSPADARLPGRHVAYALVSDGLQRPGRRPAAAGFRLAGHRPASTKPMPSSPPRCARGRSTSTWPRTTARSTAQARTTRRAGTAWPATRTASWTSSTAPASGSATPTGKLTKSFRHICWDGCMFPNATMMKRETWNDILRAMIAVRDAHGWKE